MSRPSRKPVDEKHSNYETVEVSRLVQAAQSEVWRALTEAEIVEKWFGSLSSPLTVGRKTTVEYGDGDFFLINTCLVEPPARLEYSWQFLGLGPCDFIAWSIEPQREGCLVTVRDHEPGRTKQEAAQLKRGWLDFTHRLEKFLKTGKPTRYDWRHDFDGSIELAGDINVVWRLLFTPTSQAQWLPLGESTLQEKGLLKIEDGLKPDSFEILHVEIDPPSSIRFEISSEEWLKPTSCSFNLSPRNAGALLSVSHNGWRAISKDKAEQKQQRKRFCSFWINTLRQARNTFGL